MLNQMPFQILLLYIFILAPLVCFPIQFAVFHMIHAQLILKTMLYILQLIFKLNRQCCYYGILTFTGQMIEEDVDLHG